MSELSLVLCHYFTSQQGCSLVGLLGHIPTQRVHVLCSLGVKHWKMPYAWWKGIPNGKRGWFMATQTRCLSCCRAAPVKRHSRSELRLLRLPLPPTRRLSPSRWRRWAPLTHSTTTLASAGTVSIEGVRVLRWPPQKFCRLLWPFSASSCGKLADCYQPCTACCAGVPPMRAAGQEALCGLHV